MAIGKYYDMIDELLRYLLEHPEGVKASDAHEAVADALGLTEEERKQFVPSGIQEVYKNRIGWAHDRLKRAGLSKSIRRGFWRITEDGIEYAKKYPQKIPETEIRRIREYAKTVNLRKKDPETESGEPTPFSKFTLEEHRISKHRRIKKGKDSSSDEFIEEGEDEGVSPTERIENALSDINQSVAADLLDYILDVKPLYFERIVLDVLHAMGYGTSRSDLQQVGGSHDGGIDGIISLDRLGLEKVYVQAKRWQGSVGRPQIQGFFGALAGRRANKGVFITTSTFTSEAYAFAKDVSDSIVLVDGKYLTNLMLEHGVGVSHKSLRIPTVDSDYFEEE